MMPLLSLGRIPVLPTTSAFGIQSGERPPYHPLGVKKNNALSTSITKRRAQQGLVVLSGEKKYYYF